MTLVNEQKSLEELLSEAAKNGHTETVKTLLASGAHLHAWEDAALCWSAFFGHAETVKVLLAAGANVHADDDYARRSAVKEGHMEVVQVLAKHIFAPDSWRGKSRAEIEAYAVGLYDKIKTDNPRPERLRLAAKILADCAIDCWHQVRPIPRLNISPLPARPRPL